MPQSEPPRGFTASALSLANILSGRSMRCLAEHQWAGRSLQLLYGEQLLLAVVRREGQGGIALRAAWLPGAVDDPQEVRKAKGESFAWKIVSNMGEHRIGVHVEGEGLPGLRVVHDLKPAQPLLIDYMGRDLFPLDATDNPLAVRGRVEAGQRGHNVGVVYLTFEKPDFGSVLYLQDFSSLEAYFELTGTTPDGAVGGLWPELGYLPPAPVQRGTPSTMPLPKGKTIRLSDAHVVMNDDGVADEDRSALNFLVMLASAFRDISKPDVEWHDWAGRADKTLRDLDEAPEATISHFGLRFFHPYTASEYPDSMTQCMLYAAMHDVEHWRQEAIPLKAETGRGLDRFIDRRRKLMRRYLSTVGKDKNRYAVDSWYCYHPLLELARCANDGDEQAARIVRAASEYGIRAARNFKYIWPIQFDYRDYSIIAAARNDDGLGQTDVGGLYAALMLELFHLYHEQRYLDEAVAAMDAAQEMRFDLAYQTNLTAWGAAAALRLWRVTNESRHLRMCYTYLASFFHNSVIWNSKIANAAHHPMFMQPTCLHDAPYSAIYETMDSFCAFERLLKDAGPDFDEGVRMLVSQFCRYAASTSWYYYPDALPPEILATEIRNGHIDRDLSFPLEDLYPDGQPAGQVGQEIYGAGAALIFASRLVHHVAEADFRLYCDHFLLTMDRTSDRSLSFGIDGGNAGRALFAVVNGRKKRTKMILRHDDGIEIPPRAEYDDRREYDLPGRGRYLLEW